MADFDLLNKEYKDHTVQNPIDNTNVLALEDTVYRIHSQNIRQLSITVQIVDERSNEVIETITGLASDGAVNVNSNSMIRRTASLTLSVTKDTFPSQDSLIWFNKYAKIYVGIEDNATKGEKYNFLVGTFWVGEVTYELTSNRHQVSIQLEDKMSKYVDMRLETTMLIEPGTPISSAIRALMEHLGETSFGYIEDGFKDEVVPYRLEFLAGDKVIDLIAKLRDMYMDYYCGYNVNGEFEFRRLQTQVPETLPSPKWRFDVDDNVLETLLSFREKYDFTEIRNHIVVMGAISSVTGLQPVAESRVNDSASPFNIASIGRKREVIVDDKLVTTVQCLTKAKYELWKRSNFQEVVDINTVPIYFLDGHDVIEVVHPYTKEKMLYVIEDISFKLTTDAEMSISAYRIYHVSVEYGEEDIPVVDYIERGIKNYGWINLSEKAIADAYNIMGNGKATLNVMFESNIVGGEQARVQAYPTTENQSLVFDLEDLKGIDMNSDIGSYLPGANRSVGDNLSRVIMHEMTHAVTNAYMSYEKSIMIPTWFHEGVAELVHGGKDRFVSIYPERSQASKKEEVIALAEWLLENNFRGSSDDYVASYMILWAIYRILNRQGKWNNMFGRLRQESNLHFNFLSKLMDNSMSDLANKQMIIGYMRNDMNDIWDFLFDMSDVDTGSILGYYGMNKYGKRLSWQEIVNPADFDGRLSIGFNVNIIR